MFGKLKIKKLDDNLIDIKYGQLSFMMSISERQIGITGEQLDKLLINNEDIKIKNGGINIFTNLNNPITSEIKSCGGK